MNQKSSYQINSFSTTIDTEIQRLKFQVDLFWEKELRIYKLFGLEDGMKILECGSGPGFVSKKLLNEFPNSNFTALEVDPFLVKVLKSNIDLNKFENFKVVENSIMTTGLPDNYFDFIITRLVLEHLPDPIGAINEIKRILKPGGKTIFIDNDFSIHLRTFPDIEELEALYEAYCKSRISEGGNPNIGRQLPGLLKKCGFINIDLEIVCAHSDIVGDKVFLKSEGVGISSQLVKDGYLPSFILDKIAVKWHDLLKEEDHSFYRQLFIAVGTKVEKNDNSDIKKESVQEKKQKLKIDKENLYSCSLEEQLKLLNGFIAEQVADALDIDPDNINVEIPLVDIEFDSISAVDVQDGIKQHLNIDIPVSSFFEGQSVIDISKLLIKKIKNTTSNDFGYKKSNQDDEWETGEI